MHYCIAMNIKLPPLQHSILGKISTQYTFSFVSGRRWPTILQIMN